MAGVGVEGGLQRNTHHDANPLLETNLPQTHRKSQAHDTLLSTRWQEERTCVSGGDGLSGGYFVKTKAELWKKCRREGLWLNDEKAVEGLSKLPQPKLKKPPQRKP